MNWSAAGENFEHLHALTDGRGLFEHALGSRPRPEHGYCVDDVARALVVICREPEPSPRLLLLGRHYLAFTLSALSADGTCHNRMNTDGAWTDEPGLGDWWGRAVWGLGVAAGHAPTLAMRARARLGFRQAVQRRSPHLRSMAFAALGAGDLLLAGPSELGAEELLRDVTSLVGRPRAVAAWPWPEPRLSYGNASIAEALLLAGATRPDAAVQAHGLRLLEFLVAVQTRDGHLSVAPVAGRGRADTAAGFDQQPIEVAALADACARAYALTGADQWRDVVRMSWAWFLGDNDSATPMFDAASGAGYDGLEPNGRNQNQGAESTLAALSTAQQARRLSVLA
jgi:hypothetical protein